MSIEQALIAEVQALTPQQQQEVLNFAAFLRQRSPVAANPPVPGLTQRHSLLDGRRL